MNTGNPKLLLIPIGDASESAEASGTQDKVLLYRHKKQSMREKLVEFCAGVWRVLLRIHYWLAFLYRLCRCKKWACPWRARVEAEDGADDEEGEEREGNNDDSTHQSIEMGETSDDRGNPITSEARTRMLTPITPFRDPVPPGVVDT